MDTCVSEIEPRPTPHRPVLPEAVADALVSWRARLDATPTRHGHPEPYPSAGRPGTARPATACSLAAGEMPARMTDWQAAVDDVRTRAPLDGGLRLELAPGADLGRLARPITAEHQCCPFLAFVPTVDDRGRELEVRAPAVAQELVASLVGAPDPAPDP
ncbi:hypothetical protein SAMN05660350_00239 [Geodermatophilus obscurus]|uniref:Uncharacterized protein n=1 Tax=Geodermatophilus obscurus TaxID=1861 RepID=A0A1M7RY28_9ACTN|nr:hypothetical protein [Geodermatophilus obscurus]SHN50972.1 hypothetical protein SAMN05660350_00239 [Geodermatophilus obscurus]